MVATIAVPVNTSTGNTSVNYDYNVYYGGTGAQAIGPHDVIANPLFIAPASGNFQLQSNSPAVKSGIPWQSVTTDIAGTARPGPDGGYDRGAYQQ